MKLKDIAGLIGAQLTGDGEIEITGASGLADAREGDITFIRGRKNLKEAASTRASAVIAAEDIEDIVDKPLLKAKDPYLAFIRLLEHFYVKPHEPVGVSEKAYVSDNATLGSGVSVYPFAHVSGGAVIGDGAVLWPGVFIGEGSTVGEGSVLHPNVVIKYGVTIGKRVIIHPGAVIGADGFGYHYHEGRHLKVPQVGGVIIGDDVEIGANSAIDRATTGNTVIGAGTKIDNLVQVGHNVTVGEGSVIVAQVGLSGSCSLGKGVVIGGQAGVAGHISLDDGVIVGAQSGVICDLKKGIYLSSPAQPHREALRSFALHAKLPELNIKIKELTEALEELKRR